MYEVRSKGDMCMKIGPVEGVSRRVLQLSCVACGWLCGLGGGKQLSSGYKTLARTGVESTRASSFYCGVMEAELRVTQGTGEPPC